MSTIYDGAGPELFQNGPVIRAYSSEYRCYSAVQTMRSKASLFAKKDIGSTISELGSTFHLTEETEPTVIGGDVIEWHRVYWQIPPNLEDRIEYTYNYQTVLIGVGTSELIEIPVDTTASRIRTFTYSGAPPSIVTAVAKRWVQQRGRLVMIGDDEDIAENETVAQWKPNIWMKTRIAVNPKPTPTVIV